MPDKSISSALIYIVNNIFHGMFTWDNDTRGRNICGGSEHSTMGTTQ